MTEYDVLLDDLEICNCGMPKETVEWIRDGLHLFADDHPERHFGSYAGYLFFANWANTKGYAEHGSNISVPWLTREGEALLERIDKVWENLPEGA